MTLNLAYKNIFSTFNGKENSLTLIHTFIITVIENKQSSLDFNVAYCVYLEDNEVFHNVVYYL